MFAIKPCKSLYVAPLRRYFSQISPLRSGHNRWSKIKHDKAKADASLTRQRSALSQEIATASRLHGPDPRFNPSLSTILASAKKSGIPKHLIENAISRGQGVSPSGATLENVTIEAMLPGSVAAIIECQTDSKARTISDLKSLVKKTGGTATPTSHLFEKKGRVVFANPDGLKEDAVFDIAIEAGATDVEVTEEGKIELLCDPKDTTGLAEAVEETVGLKRENVEIFWDAKEDYLVEKQEGEALDIFMERAWEDSSVQDVYLNLR